jgi:osmotically-inducible protein OsmY
MIGQFTRTRLLGAALMASGMAMSLTACATVNGQESAKSYVSDSAITTKVKADIIKDQALKGFAINVETMNGTVQLSGFVDNPEQKVEAANIARSVSGVQAVENNILVRAPT